MKGLNMTRTYSRGTYTRQSMPWGLYVSAAAMCSDGKVRRVKRIAQTADTFFSVPAAVQVRGKTVAGYITVETEQGYSVDMPHDPAIVKFCAVKYRRNWQMLPEGCWKAPDTHATMDL